MLVAPWLYQSLQRAASDLERADRDGQMPPYWLQSRVNKIRGLLEVIEIELSDGAAELAERASSGGPM